MLPPSRHKAVTPAVSGSFIALLLVGYFVQSFRHPINHDVGWFLYCGSQVLDGATLYVDVVEVNPPMMVYFCQMSVLVSRLLGLHPVAIYIFMTLLLIGLSLILVSRLTRIVNPTWSPAMRASVLLILAFLQTFLAVGNFGQREHIMVMLIFPYLALLAGRVAQREVGFGFASCVGLLAGIGFALKPFFLIAWIILECYVAYRRSRPPWRRPEGMAIILIQFLFGTSVLIWHRQYFEVLTRIGPLYAGLDQTLLDLIQRPSTLLWACGFCLWILARNRMHGDEDLVGMLVVASTAFLITAFVQLKGWSYHFYPGFASSALLLWLLFTRAIGGIVSRTKLLGGAARRVGWAVMVLILYASSFAIDRLRDPQKHPVTELVPLVDRLTESGPVMVFSTSLMPAFPLVNYAHVRWASRYPCQWFLPGLYPARRDSARTNIHYRLPEEMLQRERDLYNAVIDDVEMARPAILIVEDSTSLQGFDGNQFDFLGYYLQDTRFKKMFSVFKFVKRVREYDLYARAN